MVLHLCTSSDDALYLYQVSRKYLKGFQVLSKYLIGFQSYGPEQQGRRKGGRNLQRGIIP